MEIDIRNFVGYQALNLKLPAGQVHVFVGDTGSGKSSILDALAWATIGKARGIAKKGDANRLLKIDPAGATSVRAEFERLADLKVSWPVSISRTPNRQTIKPAELAESFKARESQIETCLGAWAVLGTKAKDRAAMMASLADAAGFDPQAVVREIEKHQKAPPLGMVFNDVKWGEWSSVSDAEANAANIRRTYHADSKGDVPPAMADRLAGNRKRFDELKEEIETAEEPEVLQKNRKLLVDLQKQIDELPKLKPFNEECPVKDKDFEQLDRQRSEMQAGLDRLQILVDEAGPFVDRLNGEFEGEAVAEVVAWITQIRERHGKAVSGIESIVNKHASAKESLEVWRDKLARHTDAEAKRSELGREILKVEKRIKGYRDPRQAELNEIRAAIQADQATIDEIGQLAGTAKKKRSNWDAITKLLAADGPIARSLATEAAGGISQARIAQASEILEIKIGLAADGSVTMNNLAEVQPSRGQRMLAGLALQDAFCQAFGVPLLLVDELESLSGDCLENAMRFLIEIAGDYETVLCCLTGEPDAMRFEENGFQFPAGVSVWHCDSGTVQRVPDPARS